MQDISEALDKVGRYVGHGLVRHLVQHPRIEFDWIKSNTWPWNH
jgi:hypothetical protein